MGAVLLALWALVPAALADELPTPAVRAPGRGLRVPPPPPPPGVAPTTTAAPIPVWVAPDEPAAYRGAPIQRRPASGRTFFERSYVPAMPIPESRSTFLAPVVVPTPFQLTSGEAATPAGGGLTINATRISDERRLFDNRNRVWESDGEVQVITAEYVSPRLCLKLGSLRIPIHLAASIHAYTLNDAIFDRLRNSVEENIFDADQAVLDAHDIGGKDLFIQSPLGGRVEVLDGSPMWKAKLVAKFPLQPLRIGRGRLYSALSVGFTPPAFGSKRESGNQSVAPEVVLAYALPLNSKARLTGATALTVPGSSELYDDLGIQHEDVLFGSTLNFEYWFSGCFAAALGMTFNSAYVSNTGLPMDLDSWYLNVGLMFRNSARSAFYLVWTENIEPTINTTPGADFSDSQKEADFTFIFGWKYAF